jgi:prophage regulatory protein
MSSKILNFPEVRARVGKSRTTLWRWEREDAFPRRLRTGRNSVGWLETEIDEWTLRKAGERSSPQ